MMEQCSLPPAPLPQQHPVQAAGPQQVPVRQLSAGCRQLPAAPAAAQPASPGCAGPTTPAPALRQPTHCGPSPTAGPSAAGAAGAASQGCASAARSACSAVQQRTLRASQWRCLHSFINCVCRSPLLKSALLAVELGSRHPGADSAAAAARGSALCWTLAQLMALHVRARLPSASESSILASLWLLESLHDSGRSSATAALTPYLEHLAAFCPLAVATLSLDWPASFCRMRAGLVAAQRDMLRRLDWRLRLDPLAEVLPCHRLLFPAHHRGELAAELVPACSQGTCMHGDCWRRHWAAAMQGLQFAVLEQAQLLRGEQQPMPCVIEEQHGRPLPEGDAQPSPSSCRPAKHARTGL